MLIGEKKNLIIRIAMRIRFVSLMIIIGLFACESSDKGSVSTGQGGSLTRFAIQNDFLYVVSNSTIQVFNTSENQFIKVGEVVVSFGLETIFAKGEYLYLGANDAMYIYSIRDQAKPEFIFRYSHIVSCDPVVVQGNTAYVTLRSGSMCNRGVNALEIINITDPYNPKLIINYPMQSPGGLGIDGGCLFVCQGEYGFSILDVTDPSAVTLIKEIKDVKAYDVIAHQGMLTLTGEDGIFQYGYDCAQKKIQLISKIPVQRAEL